MMGRGVLWLMGIAFLVLGAAGLGGSGSLAQEPLRKKALEVLVPLRSEEPPPPGSTLGQRVALGRMLFFEPRASVDGTVSCSRCHLPQLYGTDGLARSIGVMGRTNPRNAPTVLNAFLQFSQHWRGDRESVEDQAAKALVGPPSFGNSSQEAAMARLKAIPEYRELFGKAFPHDKDPVSPKNWASAIGAFERTLVVPSRLDSWLLGDDRALEERERRGLERFLVTGCADCHGGIGLGGSMYEKFGIHMDYWKATGSKELDRGRADVTGDPQDLYVFKVPSLRNVAMTPPYFHDGSVFELKEAIRVMGITQLGQEIPQEAIEELFQFLCSLTGPLPQGFSEAPVLPAGGFRP